MKIHTCFKCNTPNLHFERIKDKWILFTDKGKQHVCNKDNLKKPETTELIAPSATRFILKSKMHDLYYTGSSRASNDFKDAKIFSRQELLDKRTIFEEAYVIVDYDSLT